MNIAPAAPLPNDAYPNPSHELFPFLNSVSKNTFQSTQSADY
jgi:hypothetical protein